MAVFEIPLAPRPMTMAIALGSTTYRLRFDYADAPEAGWFMDINDSNDNPIICGMPLVTGADLLAQYAYLGFSGKLFVRTDGDPGAVPTFANLGVGAHLLWEAN